MSKVSLAKIKVEKILYRKNLNFINRGEVLERRESFVCRFHKYRRRKKTQDISFIVTLGSDQDQDQLFLVEMEIGARFLVEDGLAYEEVRDIIVAELLEKEVIPFAWLRISNITRNSNKYPPYDIGYSKDYLRIEEEGGLGIL